MTVIFYSGAIILSLEHGVWMKKMVIDLRSTTTAFSLSGKRSKVDCQYTQVLYYCSGLEELDHFSESLQRTSCKILRGLKQIN